MAKQLCRLTLKHDVLSFSYLHSFSYSVLYIWMFSDCVAVISQVCNTVEMEIPKMRGCYVRSESKFCIDWTQVYGTGVGVLMRGGTIDLNIGQILLWVQC
jgi:hypothetical protein